MPGKFGKVFQKRKSSGDVLEEANGGRPVSTFRVLERPQEPLITAYSEKPSLGLRRKTLEPRPMSEGNIEDASTSRPSPSPLNRGSGGTQKSNSSYGAYDSSSGRFSSSSTLPSSVDGHDEYPHAHPRSSKTLPTTPTADGSGASSFLRNAGRKFSFGGRKSLQAAETFRQEVAMQESQKTMPDLPIYADVHDLHLGDGLPAVPLAMGRTRAPTETSYASDSTVTQSKAGIDKLELHSQDDDGFGDIFAGIGDGSQKAKTATSAMLGRPLTENKSYTPYRPTSQAPPPLNLESAKIPISSSSHNPLSATSADGLMVASPEPVNTQAFEMGISSPTQTGSTQDPPPMSPTRQGRPRRQSKLGSKGFLPRRESELFEDTDALLVSKSVSPKNNSPFAERIPTGYRDSPDATPRANTQSHSAADVATNPWSEERPPPVPSHAKGKAPEIRLAQSADDDGVDQTLLSDVSFQALATSANRIQNRAPSPPRVKPAGKVMTPAQFEKYRNEKARRRISGDDSDSDASKSGSDEEEEEDEIERNRRIAKQRQRQEAQLSVYRQSMMKITGENPMGPSSTLRPSMDRNSGRLSTKISASSLREQASPTPDTEDEDEDVPLGILAAHGFPSKELNRPPNHVRSGSGSGIQYSSETYPPPQAPQSVVGGPSSGGAGGGNLPAFARNLPKDPFFGAGLVNQSDRQSFALGGGSPGSIYGGSNSSQTNLPPPGGLVGVIASEERARAIRRGTPSKTYGYGNQDPNGSVPLPLQMQQPIAPPPQQMLAPMPVGPEQQANIQMAQQMTQMMQMQMQWMQSMMAMQAGGQGGSNMQQMQQMQQMLQQMQGMDGMGGAGTPPNMPGMPGMPGMGGLQLPNQGMNNQRSSSMVNPPSFNPGTGMGNNGGRAMSMMGGSRAPSMMMGNGMGGAPAPGYTPSIAPSERSTIGQPSRYRPVSVVPGEYDSDRSRANSLSGQSALGGFGMGARSSTMPARPSTSGDGLGGGRNSNMINVRVVETRSSGRDDEEDEAGWEEMRKKKENKRGMWRLKKGASQGKENISPQPSVISTARSSTAGSMRSSSPKKSSGPPPPPPHGTINRKTQETSLEDMFIPDLDRL